MNAPHKPGRPEFAELPDLSERPPFFGAGKLSPPLAQTQEEQDASWRRFLELANAGYMSDGVKMSRDEMNER